MKAGRVRTGPIRSIEEADRAIRDLEESLQLLQTALLGSQPPAAGTVGVLVRESDGLVYLYTLLDAAGTTLVLDQTNRTISISAP